jgi:hypothetical protein
MPKIEIEIGGDNSDLQRKIAEAEILLKRLRKDVAVELKAGNIDLAEKMTVEVNKAKESLKGLQAQYTNTTKSTNTLSKSTANGSNALMQFSRIAQDAPFGIMGIGNNITATAESFSYLSKSAGGTGNALKAVASSMMGTGGILLAVSLVTSALTYMSQNGITVGDIFDKLSGNFDAVGNSMKKAFDEGAKSALEERGNLLGLIAVAQSETVSRQARTQAVADLQAKYPAYLGNLSKEEIMYGNLTTAVNAITQALISKAVAEKLAEDAVDPTIKLFKANALIISQKKQQITLEKDLAAEIKSNADAGFGGATNKAVQLKNAIANNNVAIKETRSNIGELTKVVKSYEDNISSVSQVASQLLIKPIKIVQPKLSQAPKLEAINIETKITTTAVIENQQKEGQKVLKTIQDTLNIATSDFKLQPIALEIPLQPIIPPDTLTLAKQQLIDFNDDASNIINDNIGDTFGNLASVIGGAIANGGNVLQSAGSALLAGLGSVMVQLGKMAITTGLGIKGIKVALKSLNPAVAIAGGIALIALGTAVSSSVSGLGGSMGSSGGSGNSGSGGASTNSGGNSFRGSQSSGFGGNSTGGGFGSVVFEISGQSLIGVLGNALDKNKRLGGNLQVG